MATYQASIITDSAEISVTASLTATVAGNLTDWRGSVSASPEALRPLLNTTQARIRLDGGQEAEILITDPSQALRGRLDVIGNGEPPF